ncbi:MAG TPA: efflux transporter periplasmic adaptor subunit, partial [Hyphomonas sp.]|nr:efflux transporter periplasmic adaptor subunit [Hyphomonas sp.]
MFTRNLLFILAAVFVSSLSAQAQRGGPASVFVEPVQERSFAMRIEALGTLEPNEQVDLTLNAADRVRAIYFDDGDRVKQGKTLLSLAQREQAALVEAAEATLDEARRQQ